MRHVSETLLAEIDEAVGIALDRVQDGGVERSTVAVTFTAGYDKAGQLAIVAKILDGGTKAHSWNPAPRGQQAFSELLETVEKSGIESVTFATEGREPVVLGRRQV